MHRRLSLYQHVTEIATFTWSVSSFLDASLSRYLVKRCLLFFHACLQLFHCLLQTRLSAGRVEVDDIVLQTPSFFEMLAYLSETLTL